MATTPPATVEDFKAKFDRDFPYGTGTETVRDKDITGAFDEALATFDARRWGASEVKLAFMYLAAHILVTNLQAAGGLGAPSPQAGPQSQNNGIIVSKGVGSVNMSLAQPPARVLANATLYALWQTSYGQSYVRMIMPKLIGNTFVVPGPMATDVGADSGAEAET